MLTEEVIRKVSEKFSGIEKKDLAYSGGNSGEYDAVTLLIRKAEYLAKKRHVPLANVITNPEALSEVYDEMAKIKKLNIHDILYWLERWKVFYPIPNAKEIIQKHYREMSKEIHAKIFESFINMAIRKALLDRVLIEELTKLIDIMIVSILNTINNCCNRKEKEYVLNHLNKKDFKGTWKCWINIFRDEVCRSIEEQYEYAEKQ